MLSINSISRRNLILFILLFSTLLPSCLIFNYNQSFKPIIPSVEQGEFIPIVYPQIKSEDGTIVPFLIYRSKDKLPYDIALYLCDPTAAEKSKPYDQFVIENLEIKYNDGKSNILVNKDMPLKQRTFKIMKEGHNIIHNFQGKITRPVSFSVYLTGYSILNKATKHPFKRIQKFEYSKERSWQTVFSKWKDI